MTVPDPDHRLIDRRWFLARSAALAAAVGSVGIAAACAAAPSDEPGAAPPPGSADGAGSGSVPGTTSGGSATTVPTDPTGIATQAWLAGLPLLTTRRTMQTFAGLAGLNTMIRTQGLSNPTSRLVVAPNHDTVYVLAVLDLSAGPLLFTLPAIPDRYHVMQFMDAWMGGFGLIGTRSNGGQGGTWVLAPSGWTGTAPDGAAVLSCPTPHAMLLGRIRAIDDEDAKAAAALGRAITLTPLDGTGADPAALVPLGPALGPPNTAGEDGAASFDELGDALAADPPVTAAQRAAFAAAASLGIGPGLRPGTDPSTATLLATAAADGLAAIENQQADGSTRINGWDVNLTLGTAGTDGGLEARAVIAKYFWGPVPAEEAVYPKLVEADDGLPLDGSKRYALRFGPGGQPPVDAFWSVTAYGSDLYLVPNPQNRYSLSGQTPGLDIADDGSVELLLQHEPPVGREANWLPVPAGPFTLIMRLYLPGPAILDGTYEYPPVTVV